MPKSQFTYLQSMNESFNPSRKQSITQSINQSPDQSPQACHAAGIEAISQVFGDRASKPLGIESESVSLGAKKKVNPPTSPSIERARDVYQPSNPQSSNPLSADLPERRACQTMPHILQFPMAKRHSVMPNQSIN